MKNRVKEYRCANKLTQEQLGKIIGVSRQAINAIENEKFEPSIWIAHDIAKTFNCSIEDIFIFEESERKSRADKSRGVV